MAGLYYQIGSPPCLYYGLVDEHIHTCLPTTHLVPDWEYPAYGLISAPPAGNYYFQAATDWNIMCVWTYTVQATYTGPSTVSDDFNRGNDSGWERVDGSDVGLAASTYSFPSDGTGGFAYQIYSPAPPVTDYGPAASTSYRTNVYSDFFAAVDLVAWDNSLDQGFGLGARMSSIGPGTGRGYGAAYAPNHFSGPVFAINRITDGELTALAFEFIALNPTHRYRLTMSGVGSLLTAQLFDLADLATPLKTLHATDTTYSAGVCGLVSAYAGSQITDPVAGRADVTFDNYFTASGPPTPGLTWSYPTPITYGSALSSAELNATATFAGTNLPGRFEYTPTNGTVLDAGPHTLAVTFTPTDLANYSGASAYVSLVVSPAPLSVTATNATRFYGQTNPPFGGTITGLTNSDPITVNYTCSATPTDPPGLYSIVPSLCDPNNRLGNYTVAITNGTLTVACAAIALNPTNLPAGFAGTAYSQMLNAEGGANPYAFARTAGTLPRGLSLSGAGLLSGTPSSCGTDSFTVTATDANGCPGSQTYTVIVEGNSPTISLQPQNITNRVGAVASFSVTATGTAPLNYQWQHEGTNLTDNAQFSGSLTNSLTITNLLTSDAGYYRVIVANSCGSITSTAAYLTVTSPPPTMTVVDNFNSGTNSGWEHWDLGAVGQPAATYSLTNDGAGGFAYRIYAPAPLVTNFGPARAYSYRTNVYSDFFVSADEVAIDETYPQAVSLMGRMRSVGLFQTSGYGFTCYATWRWTDVSIYRVDNEIPTTIATTRAPALDPAHRYRLVASGVGSALTVQLFDLADLTQPLVNVSGSDGTYPSGVCGLAVLYPDFSWFADVTFDNYVSEATPAPVIVVQPQSITNSAGTTASLTAVASGMLPLSYQWQFYSTNLPGATNATLTLTNVQFSDAGPYAVLVTNTYGSTSGTVATLTVTVLATASAGGDQTICAGNSTGGLGGSVGGGATGGTWTTTGSGTFAPNTTTLNATYTPSSADNSAGTVTLTLTTTGGAGGVATTNVVVTINPAATASAGAAQTVCSGAASSGLGGTVGGGATGGTWSSSGTGTFAPNTTTLNASYTASAADASTGTVTLTLGTTGQQSPCSAATAQVVVTVNKAATASAGAAQTVCSGVASSGLGGTVGGGATGGTWTTSGTGMFAPNTTTLNASYTPSDADASTGTVTLTLSSTGQQSPCGAATATVAMAVRQAATASAGGNQTISAGSSTAGLGGTVGGGATGGTWTSSGTGTFSPAATVLNAAYGPSSGDIAAGTVTLTLTSTGQSPCPAVSASVTITINASPLPASPIFDSFNNCNDNGWVRVDMSAVGLPPSTYSFPSDGAGGCAYRVYSPAPPVTSYGPAASSSYRTNVYSDFFAAVDLVAWDNSLDQGFGLGARMSSIGPGTGRGYGAAYAPNHFSGPVFAINRITDGELTALAFEFIALNPTHRYRLTMSGVGSLLTAQLFDLADLATPLKTLQATDTTYSTGVCGLVSAYAGSQITDPVAGRADVTFDNYVSAATPAPVIVVQPQSITNSAGTTASLTAVASGMLPLSYQWQFYSTNLPGATNVTLTLTNVQFSAAGPYAVLVTNAYGSTNSDVATLTVTVVATASAGGNQTICAGGSTAGLGGSVGGDATGGVWSSSGTGTFAPSMTTLNANYTPSAADVSMGTVTLTLTPTGGTGGVATTNVLVTINPAAAASAGGAQTVCSGVASAGLGGTVGGGATGGIWTTSGSGTFAPNATTLNASYTASAADASTGTVTLTLTTTGQQSPCSAATVSVVVTIRQAATASAGGNQTISAGSSTVGLGGTVGGGATGGTWTSSGTGTFSPTATVLNATYNPSAGDIAACTVTLTLTTMGQSPCPVATARVVVTINAASPCDGAPSGLVNWWRCESNAFDSIGTKDGITVGGVAGIPGMVGGALHFDGSSGQVAISNTTNLQTLSVEAWVRFDSLDSGNTSWPGQQYLVFRQNSRMYNFEAFALAKGRDSGGDHLHFVMTSAYPGVISDNIASTNYMTTNVFYHVAGTFDGTNMSLYVDGVLHATAYHPYPVDYGQQPMFLGNSGTNVWYGYLAGTLDEVSLYNRPLLPSEVAALYAAGSAGKCLVSPPPLLRAIGQSSGAVLLSWTAVPGRNYQVQFATNLRPANWSNYGGILSTTNRTIGVLTSSGPEPRQFYRVLLLP
jgi:hypothetical protein